jgi:hypothetical protein
MFLFSITVKTYLKSELPDAFTPIPKGAGSPNSPELTSRQFPTQHKSAIYMPE